MARVQEALAIAEEAKCKVKAQTSCLKVERTSDLLELGAAKDKVSFLHSQARKDKEAIEEDYHKALELIFAYGCGCCVFKHNIYGDQLEVSDGMPNSFNQLPSEFFANPKCPLAPTTTEVMETKVEQSKVTKEPAEGASTGNHN